MRKKFQRVHLFVAPMMNTFFLSDMPSISVSIWLMTLSAAPPASPAPPPLDLAIESNSSKNKMQGAACLACMEEVRTSKGIQIWLNALICIELSLKTPSVCLSYYTFFIPFFALTLSNTSRTLASDSPNHIVSISGPLMETKFAWHSLAIALARRVFPHPGGP